MRVEDLRRDAAMEQGHRALAQAVLRQAVLDRDWRWLLGNDESFQLWCGVAEINPAAVSRAAREFRARRQPAWFTALQDRWQPAA